MNKRNSKIKSPKKLFAAALAYIKEHPQEWDQSWPIHTRSCCLLAHVQRIAHPDYYEHNIAMAMEVLHLSEKQASWLYKEERTMADFEYFLKHWRIPAE